MTTYSLPNAFHTMADSQQRANAANTQFNAALAAGESRKFWAALTRRPAALRHLDGARGQAGRSAGRRLVAVAAIRGSEGRTRDFDDQFHPLSSRNRQRWASVARALDEGVRLPPVELIQVGADYYVRDGHHRISVAAALGQEAVEAVVTVWVA
jgi:hypothetical protein